MDRAIDAYKAAQYEEAASEFYAVLRFSDEEGSVSEAQYGLASSFQKLGLPLASLKYYEDIVKVGSDHPYFDKAVEGLVDVGEALQDDLKTPQVLDSIYNSENTPSLSKMSPQILQRVHFVLGRYMFGRGNMTDARDFLKTIKEGNPSYPNAQYMLGLIRLGVGRPDAGSFKAKYQEALSHFENVRKAIPSTTKDPELLSVRDLATLGVARSYYEQAYALDDGDPARAEGLKKAIAEYRGIPRFSEAWSDALFERAWAHTVANEYGRALGALHSLRAPYFQDKFYPETEILQAIVYYYNCQWDQVRDVLEGVKASYEPMVKQTRDVLEKGTALDQWRDILTGASAGASGALPEPVVRGVVQDPKYAKMEAFLRELERERQVFERSQAFAKGEIGREMTEFAAETRDAFIEVMGKFIKTKLQDVATQLSDVSTRASLVSLETQTAEIDWLEQGRSIAGAQRRRQPRPFIPDDTFQFWWFRNEYWLDELGYYEYTIKTECYED